jgi:hypothetical protein
MHFIKLSQLDEDFEILIYSSGPEKVIKRFLLQFSTKFDNDMKSMNRGLLVRSNHAMQRPNFWGFVVSR